MLICIFCSIIGFISIIAAISIKRSNTQFERWPQISAKIIRKQMSQYSGSGKEPSLFELQAEYEFTVNNQKYIGNSIFLKAKIGEN